MSEQPHTPLERHSRDRGERDRKRALSADELESGLTDICAEIYYLEAERLRTGELLAVVPRDADAGGENFQEAKRLSERRSLIESRLEALEARAAGIRGQVERARMRSA